jgi:hypothetical protein
METPEKLNSEIAELEQKLKEKKQEFLETGKEQPEKQVFSEVIKEHVQETSGARELVLSPAGSTSPGSSVPRQITTQDEEKISELIAYAFKHGLQSAVKEAKKLNDPFFVDILHDRLADEYYEKLLQARKIKQN